MLDIEKLLKSKGCKIKSRKCFTEAGWVIQKQIRLSEEICNKHNIKHSSTSTPVIFIYNNKTYFKVEIPQSKITENIKTYDELIKFLVDNNKSLVG